MRALRKGLISKRLGAYGFAAGNGGSGSTLGLSKPTGLKTPSPSDVTCFNIAPGPRTSIRCQVFDRSLALPKIRNRARSSRSRQLE